MTLRHSVPGVLALVALTLACGGGSGAPDLQGTIAGLQGGGQSAPVTTILTPFQVTVLDDAGAPKPGVTVAWTVSGGGGTVAPGTSITDAAGVAEATATLGTLAGVQDVRASASGYGGSPE